MDEPHFCVPAKIHPTSSLALVVASGGHSLDPQASWVLVTVLAISLPLRPMQLQPNFMFFSNNVGKFLLKIRNLLLNFHAFSRIINNCISLQALLHLSNELLVIPSPHG